jgi:prepilin signal peptidase PulO-like enzyme (type II secretory pathway)
MFYIFIFIFGTIIGSFLNVVSLRYGTGESIVYRGSRCFSCGKRLSWVELIPIFSFLIQKGRCRNCSSKISWQYPIVEMLTGVIFVLIAQKIFNSQFLIFNEFLILNFQTIFNLIFYWLVASLLIIISVYDIRHQVIPNKLVYLFDFLSFGYWFLMDKSLAGFLAGAAFFAFLFLFWLSSRGRWMGLGDAKIALGCGWLLGFINGAVGLLIAFWSGALIGVFLLLFAPKTFKLKSRIPFGPFLAGGAMAALLFGNDILQIYFNIFGRI